VTAERRKVLSIVGPGRSGTTIMSSVLAEVPGFFGAGELRWLWARDLPEQRVCGCGEPPSSCPVWSRVVEQSLGVAPGNHGSTELGAVLRPVVEEQRRVSAAGHRLRVLRSPRTHRHDESLDRLTAATVSLVEALFAVTGARTVIDASKRPQEAAVLAGAGTFDHYVLHVVRDPRAVVHSWRRAKPLPAQTGRTAMATRSRRKTLMRWVENCAGAEVLRRQVAPERWLSVRYEDFADRPRETVQRILELLGEPGDPFTTEDSVVLGPNHNLSGNPNRFRTGQVRIVRDDEWTRRMSLREQALIEAVTLPFLLRYRYPLLARPLRPGS
jgi:hypothetical protein